MKTLLCKRWARLGALAMIPVSVGTQSCSKGENPPSESIASRALSLENGSFDDDYAAWWGTGNVADSMVVTNGELCVTVPGALGNPWDAIVGQGDLTLVEGQRYTLAFTASASSDATMRATVQEPDAPYGDWINVPVDVGFAPVSFEQSFVMGSTSQVPQLGFQIGGAAEEVTFCFDDVSLEPAAVPNLLQNGSFEDDLNGWWTAGMPGADEADLSNQSYCALVPSGTNIWDAQLGQDLSLDAGTTYKLTFYAQGDGPALNAVVQDGTTYVPVNTLPITPNPDGESYELILSPSEAVPNAQVVFQGAADAPWNLCLDDVVLTPLQAELLSDGNFDQSAADGALSSAWWTSGPGMESPDLSDGQYCVLVPPFVPDPNDSSVQPHIWDAQLGQDVQLQAGVSYTFSFYAQGEPELVRALVQDPDNNYEELIAVNLYPTAEGAVYEGSTTPEHDVANGKVLFQVGGHEQAWSLCLDDVSLVGGGEPPRYEPDTGPRVRVNQVGYLPFGPKLATLVSDATDPVPWQVFDADSNLVLTGESVPYGTDPSSELDVHTIDFSSLSMSGDGFTLAADGETSYPFSLGDDPYEALRKDSLSFYYTQRSGEVIDGAVAGEAYARPAGHVSAPGDGAVNQGDVDVPCQPADNSEPIYGEPWTCDYTLDVAGGWYDAGDQGKYVVNGGISVFQLLNAFERHKTAPSSDLDALGDGSLRVPEANNGVPDVLDEARHELEFFLSMQVPRGEPLAGMVHHKVHDDAWTGLPLLPHLDPQLRWLHRPSTAATLNLAATAAQGARIYALYDEEFSERLLDAARTAWDAALQTPDLYAPAEDGASGGGPYEDFDVSDEFYWAAAELFLTTDEDEFLQFVLDSPQHSAEVFTSAGIIWREMAALARMDLATVPSSLPDRDAVIASVIDGAQGYLEAQGNTGFGQPYFPDNGTYVWGSNSQVLNNLVVIGTAYDLTGDQAFRDSALEGIDYILGRNGLNISYVTGYGSVFSQNQHSRWYAASLDPELPHPPFGSVAGGPNSESGSWDPVAQGLFGYYGCSPSLCYVDDIGSWSTNEITLNWNSALSWVASFVADQDTAESSPYGECEVEFRTLGERVPGLTDKISDLTGHFASRVTIKNTGKSTLKGWDLTWSFIGDQVVQGHLLAKIKQDGAMVTATPSVLTKKIKPGQKKSFWIVGRAGSLANPEPETFFLNGKACVTK